MYVGILRACDLTKGTLGVVLHAAYKKPDPLNQKCSSDCDNRNCLSSSQPPPTGYALMDEPIPPRGANVIEDLIIPGNEVVRWGVLSVSHFCKHFQQAQIAAVQPDLAPHPRAASKADGFTDTGISRSAAPQARELQVAHADIPLQTQPIGSVCTTAMAA